MAKITLLHWNIQNFSKDKVNLKKNGQPLIDYIANVVILSKANIVCLVELYENAAEDIGQRLIAAINQGNGVASYDNKWAGIKIDSRHGKPSTEAYVVLYKLGNNFEAVKVVPDKPERLAGLTDQKLDEKGNPCCSLSFNKSQGPRGGRQPYYVVFETNEKKSFSVLTCHIMFSSQFSRIGVASMGLVAQCQAIQKGGKTVKLDASLTSGDFNVDFNVSDYENLLKIPSSQCTTGKTTLKADAPPVSYPSPTDYLANSYDNVFQFKRSGKPAANTGIVMDLIGASTTMGSGGALVDAAGGFDASEMREKYGKYIEDIPPEDYNDSFRLIRGAISDHLPVYVTLEI